jgi:predicted acylesterase/phospholipase RssA
MKYSEKYGTISVVNMKKIASISLILLISLSFSVTALVLSGGGARGFAHVGLLRVLQLYNIKPKVVIGTSAGALIGAFYACGYTPLEMMDVIKKFNKENIMEKAFPNLPTSVVSWKPIEKFLYQYLGNKKIEDLKIKLAIVATNIRTGQIEVFTKGNLLKAVEASCSIPGFFPPVKIGNNYYVDGGILLDDPTTIAHSFGADKVVLSIVSDLPLGIKKDTPYFERVFFDLLYNLRNSLSKRLNINDMSNMLDLTMKSVDFFNFSQFMYAGVTKNVNLVLNPLDSIRKFSTVFDFGNSQKYYQLGMLNAIEHSKELKELFK